MELSFLYVCMMNTIYLFSFVETPRKFIIAELSISKLGKITLDSVIISTDEDPRLRIESPAIIYLRGVSRKLNKYIVELFFTKTRNKKEPCKLSLGSATFVANSLMQTLDFQSVSPPPPSKANLTIKFFLQEVEILCFSDPVFRSSLPLIWSYLS